jgi:hypothetical protein
MRALGTGLALVLTAGLASTSAPVPAGTPAAQDPPIVTTADAVQPQEGEDYTLLATLHLPKRMSVDEIGSTGEVVLYRGSQDPHLVLLDPESGRRTPLPDPGGASVLDLTADTIWYAEYDRRGSIVAIDRFDRSTERMRRLVLLRVGSEHSVSHLEGYYEGRWYFGTGRPVEPLTHDIWSVRFGKPHTVRSEVRDRADVSLIGHLLTWTTLSVHGPSHVVLRDLDTGEVTRWKIPDGCSAGSSLRGNGTQFVLNARCDRPEGQTYIMDGAGAVSAILRVDADEGAFGAYERGTMFHSYFYDFMTGMLYDLDKPSSSLRSPVQVWPQGDRDLVVRLK